MEKKIKNYIYNILMSTKIEPPYNKIFASALGELSEIFQWRDEVKPGLPDWSEKDKEHLGQELSDVFLYLIRLSEECNVDLPAAAIAKIEKAGENLEKKYIKFLMKAIKLTGLAKKVWTKEDGSIDENELHDTAEVIFAVILAVAAISATGGAFSAFKEGSTLFAAIEGGLTGVKGSEIATILSKVGSKLT